MKKYLSVLLLLFTIFCLCACSGVTPILDALKIGARRLTVLDENGLIYDKPENNPEKIRPGETLTFHCVPLDDADVVMQIDGENVSYGKTVEKDGETLLEYTFTMPENDTTLAFLYRGKNGVTLSSLYPALADLTEEDVASVRIEWAYIGVSPAYATPKVTQTTDPRDITYNLAFLKDATLSVKEYDICGGRYDKLILTLKSGDEMSFTISNGFLNEGTVPLTYAFDNYRTVYPQILYGETVGD